jgi:hypothetical protein
MKTLTGKTIDEVRSLLDEPLPPQAYKRVPGAGDFTDIDSNWQNRVFNSVFGLCGFGWGFEFQAGDIEVRMDAKDNGKLAADAILKKLVLWFKLVDGTGIITRHDIPAASANRNEFGNAGYAMKGAITSALGAAASKLGWQESVYLGIRDHNNTQAKAPARPSTGTAPDPAANIPPKAETTAQPPVDPPPHLQYWRCGNGHVMVVSEMPAKCPTCGDVSGLSQYPDLAAARKGPDAPPPQSNPPVFNTIACFSCGATCQPADTTCPSCGQPVMKVDDTKALHKEFLRLVGGQRPVWLATASTVTGRQIKGYSECSCHELIACIRHLRSNPLAPGTKAGNATTTTPNNPPPAPPVDAGGSGAQQHAGGNPPPPPPPPPPTSAGFQPPAVRNLTKLQTVERIFALGKHIDLNTPPEILRELSQRFGRPVTSSGQCTIEELTKFLDEVEFACHQKGVNL